VLLYACAVVSNRAFDGAAFYVSDATMMALEGTLFEYNTGKGEGGCGYITGNSIFTMESSVLQRNYAMSFGGALAVVGPVRVVMTDVYGPRRGSLWCDASQSLSRGSGQWSQGEASGSFQPTDTRSTGVCANGTFSRGSEWAERHWRYEAFWP